ncbi:MAG TPA: response regulator [Alphaproteobacteria bacterium]|nr:response regulator [Alphaproteobacteria bacterium]
MAENYNFSTFCLLILEDNRFIRKLVRELCRGFGFPVIAEADNVAEATSLLENDHFDLAICDWEMHPVDGAEFVKRVRSKPESPLRYLPIIMLTAHTAVARVKTARDLGVTEFLAKPISAKTLLGRICSIVDHPRPFIEAPNYFGPDRRRHKDVNYAGIERRSVPLPPNGDAAAAAVMPRPLIDNPVT